MIVHPDGGKVGGRKKFFEGHAALKKKMRRAWWEKVGQEKRKVV